MLSQISTEAISAQLRDHQTGLTDWRYARLAHELHRWVQLFDLEFKLQLPSYPVIFFAPLRSAYATYAWFRGAAGTKDNITFNTHELNRDPALILRTHCHELIHLWQHYAGTPGKRNYHNAEFRAKAQACGLIVSPQGCTTGHTEAFTNVLAKHGVELVPLAAELRLYGASPREQKLKKWSCGCTNVRCATTLTAVCVTCQQTFARVPSIVSIDSLR